MRSLLRAVQCTESLQKYGLVDRRLPSKVSIIKMREGAGLDCKGKHAAEGCCLHKQKSRHVPFGM
jgi:hypothetical protein